LNGREESARSGTVVTFTPERELESDVTSEFVESFRHSQWASSFLIRTFANTYQATSAQGIARAVHHAVIENVLDNGHDTLGCTTVTLKRAPQVLHSEQGGARLRAIVNLGEGIRHHAMIDNDEAGNRGDEACVGGSGVIDTRRVQRLEVSDALGIHLREGRATCEFDTATDVTVANVAHNAALAASIGVI